ncbi:MAG: class I SAM-dependent methyltransferase, partial [Solirubrobacterales bacterium]
ARRGALSPLVRFVHGDAESLPFGRGTFDAVLCECSLCTFPDKPRALAEMRRVLRGRGTVMISDVIAVMAELPAPLRGAAGQVACVGDARDSDGYAALLNGSGFDLVAHERHDGELVRMLDRVQARVRVARMTGLGRMQGLSGAFDVALDLLELARDSALGGLLGYGVFVARARS